MSARDHPLESIICDAGVARRIDLSGGFRLLARHAARRAGVQLTNSRRDEVDMI